MNIIQGRKKLIVIITIILLTATVALVAYYLMSITTPPPLIPPPEDRSVPQNLTVQENQSTNLNIALKLTPIVFVGIVLLFIVLVFGNYFIKEDEYQNH